MTDPNRYGTWQERILAEKPRQTNADRIRSMTNWEMAKFFVRFKYCAEKICSDGILEWLEQECE